LQQKSLEDERKKLFAEAAPHMELLARMKERMGERYPEAMFLPPVMVTKEEKELMLRAMQVIIHLLSLLYACTTSKTCPNTYLPSCTAGEDCWVCDGVMAKVRLVVCAVHTYVDTAMSRLVETVSMHTWLDEQPARVMHVCCKVTAAVLAVLGTVNHGLLVICKLYLAACTHDRIHACSSHGTRRQRLLGLQHLLSCFADLA
jgi:hypothetical protein